MATKPEKPKAKKAAKARRPRGVKTLQTGRGIKYNEETVDKIMRMRFIEKMSFGAIGEALEIKRNTVFNIVERNEHLKNKYLSALEIAKEEAAKRSQMPSLARLEAIASDSAQVIELSIFLLTNRLKGQIEELHKPEEERIQPVMTTREIKEVIETVMPYVQSKKTESAGRKKADQENPKGKLLSMMFQQPKAQ